MKNIHASDGLAEDLIRSFVQIGCAEIHAKTLLEKSLGEVEEGIIDTENEEVLSKHLEKIDRLQDDIDELADIRRKMMLKLFRMYDGDKSYWCQVKHLGIAMMTAFEAYQASDRDEDLFQMALKTNKAFIKALAAFIGVEIVECASCFADLLKGEEHGL